MGFFFTCLTSSWHKGTLQLHKSFQKFFFIKSRLFWAVFYGVRSIDWNQNACVEQLSTILSFSVIFALFEWNLRQFLLNQLCRLGFLTSCFYALTSLTNLSYFYCLLQCAGCMTVCSWCMAFACPRLVFVWDWELRAAAMAQTLHFNNNNNNGTGNRLFYYIRFFTNI